MKLFDLNVLLADANFKKDPKTEVWASGAHEFAYNDGDETENYILESITQSQDVSVHSEELVQYIKDWPSLYHLSHRRSNLLKPFKEWFKGKRILEIGCGCGAISRFLGEAGAQVVSVEGSLRRATIARARCKDLKNVDVICAPSNTLPDLGKFDAVLLIGVLEYARCFLGKNGQALLLANCEERLTEQGHIFVAIENKLGIKYLAGAPEDHVGIPMHGINSAYTDQSVATFGRVELKGLLSEAGFKGVEEYLPLPDYKLPCSVVTPSGWQEYSSELSTLALESAFQDPQGIANPTFSIEQGIKNVWENNLASDLSNSFLMVAAKSNILNLNENIIAYHYSDSRKSQYQKFLTIEKNKNNQLIVHSQPSFPDLAKMNKSSNMKHVVQGDVSFISGESLFVQLIKLVNEPNWTLDSVVLWAKKWIKGISSLANIRVADLKIDTKISGGLIDAMPFNAIETKDGIQFFDLEWQDEHEITFGYLLFRALFVSLSKISSVCTPDPFLPNHMHKITTNLFEVLGYELNSELIDIYIKSDYDLSKDIYNVVDFDTWNVGVYGACIKPRINLATLTSNLNKLDVDVSFYHNKLEECRIELDSFASLENQLSEQKEDIDSKTLEIEILNQKNQIDQNRIDSLTLEIEILNQKNQIDQNRIDSLKEELKSIYKSRSWRVIKHVRFLSHKLSRIRPLLNHPILLMQFFYIKFFKKIDGGQYLKNNLDVNASEIHPLVHYLKYGKHENRALCGLSEIQQNNGARNEASFLNAIYPAYLAKEKMNFDFVPKSLLEPVKSSALDIKAIAFYLPQFHPFTENDMWWGKGFTEWKNVAKAKPQFCGHYQPHLPSELGFYDLRLTSEVMRQQIDLAKLYGIQGFCFYHYWFDGHRLMELPVNNFLKDKSLDINFCLCWANENWSRRWDGMDQDILIGQNHSPEDDQAFFEDILPALKDERYIQIDGKPLLLLYRPTLLPNMKETSIKWREMAVENGLKGLYLACVNSFEVIDPLEYGFDACVEFPPHRVNVKEISSEYTVLNPTYEGFIYDYTELPVNFGLKENNQCVEFKGVMPSWDNEARKTGKGHSFANSSPQLYAEWLNNAAQVTMKKRPEERLIFINAWNEWAEGAHLEPCAKYGYAFLQATRSVLSNYSHYQNEYIISLNATFSPKNKTVVVLHLFYEDLIDDIFTNYLASLQGVCDLIVTVQESISNQSLDKIRQYFLNSYFLVVKNRGRDILPFIEAIPLIKKFNYQYICKLHSKKSPHRQDGDTWRDQLFSSLLPSLSGVESIISQLEGDSKIGLLASKDTLMRLSEHVYAYKGNMVWLNKLLVKLNRQDLIGNYDMTFPAGSMYWCKTDAIVKLIDSNFIQKSDFEFEAGQLDGTLAHALERLMGLLIQDQGYITELR